MSSRFDPSTTYTCRLKNYRLTDFSNMLLSGITFDQCVFPSVDFTTTVFFDVTFLNCNLYMSSFRGCDLSSVSFPKCSLENVGFQDAKMPQYEILPEEGAFYAYKVVYNMSREIKIIKLLVPSFAQRTSCLISRKCRVSQALVIQNGGPWCSPYKLTDYKSGEYIVADYFDPDITKDCTYGIHVFLTKKDCIRWCDEEGFLPSDESFEKAYKSYEA